MELFKLFGSIFVDNKAANDSMQKTESLGQKVAKSLGNGIKTAAKLGATLLGMATAGAGALLTIANKSAETADRVDKMSLKLNLSRKGFQEWDHVMSQSGMQIESLQGGMKKLVGVIDNAVTGNASAAESFSRVGISVDDLRGKSPEEVFEMTVKKLQEMPPSAEKAALANDLLGKSAAEMAPILNVSADEVEKLKQEARDLGLVMSDEAIDAGVKFGDTMANVKDAFSMVVTKIGVSVMPMIQRFLDWVLANMPTIQTVFGQVFLVIGNFVQSAVDIFNNYLLPVFQYFYDWFVTNWPQISSFISNTFSILQSILTPIVETIVSVIQYMAQLNESFNFVIPVLAGVTAGFIAFKTAMMISSIIDAVRNGIALFTAATQGLTLAQAALNAVMALNPFVLIAVAIGVLVAAGVALYKNWDKIVAMAKILGEKLTEIWNSIKNTVSNVWNGIKTTISNVWESIKSSVSNAVNNVRSVISSVFESVRSVVSIVWNGIKTAISNPIQAAYNVVKSVIDRIKGIFNFKFQWPHIPLPHFSISGSANPLKWLTEGVPRLRVQWYAKGGIFDKPTIFNTPYGLKGVGEAGPEAVTPISKLTDYVREAVRTENGNLSNRIDVLISLFSEFLSIFKNSKSDIYFNSEKVGEVLNPILARMIVEGDF